MSDSIIIGPFTAGEIPPPLRYVFEDADGNPIDLTGFTAKFVYKPKGGTAVENDAELDNDPTTGAATYIWVADDLETAAIYTAEMWVGDGTNRYASPDIRYRVRAAVAVPAI